MIKTTALIANWRMEGNALDSSGNGLNGTVDGATVVTGKFGRGYSFVTDDKITLPNNAVFGLSPSQDQTILGWFNADSVTSTIIYDGRNSTDAVRGYFVGITTTPSNILRTWLYIGSSATSVQVSTPISAGIWYHFATTFDRDGFMRLYLNGELKSSTSISAYNTSNLSPNVSPVIGTKSYAGSGILPFNGDMDEIRMYNKVLSVTDIKRDMLGMHPLTA